MSATVSHFPTQPATITLPDVCPECGLAMHLHRGVTSTYLGCGIAAEVRRQSDQPRHPQRWNDPMPAITAAARAALCDGTCGPVMEVFMAGFTHDEQLAIAHALARVVITADRADLARRGR